MPERPAKLHMSAVPDGLRLEMEGQNGEHLSVEITGHAARQTLMQMYSCLEQPLHPEFSILDQEPAIMLLDPAFEATVDETERLHLAFKGKHLPPFRFAVNRHHLVAMMAKLLERVANPLQRN